MLQSCVAWYQLISSHPTSCVAVCWRLDGPDPFPQGPPIPQGGAGYHCSIYILNLSTLSLRYLIWSSFQYLILTYILVTYISIHACLAWNQLSSSYPTSYIAVAWRLADASFFPGPTHSTGGGGLMGYDHDHGRGGGGGTRNLEHIYIYIWSVYHIHYVLCIPYVWFPLFHPCQYCCHVSRITAQQWHFPAFWMIGRISSWESMLPNATTHQKRVAGQPTPALPFNKALLRESNG